jgi:SAM-dependent methyltransferase
MYRFLEAHPGIKDPVAAYFDSGESLYGSLRSALGEGSVTPGGGTVLDFACGYGRLARFLGNDIGRDKVVVADIDARAVDFCKAALGVRGFYSTRHPADLVHDAQYEAILVVSLFSHLSVDLWAAWLERLYTMVQDGGILLFSTHGMHAYGLLGDQARAAVDEVREGFYYVGVSETKRLSPLDYGTTYVSQEYVEEAIRRQGVGTLEAYLPRLLWSFQDVYVLRKR